MPVHDWTRVKSGIFHDFHQTWITAIKNTLNSGLLPKGYYALEEQIADGPRPDVIALETLGGEMGESDFAGAAVAVAECPPRVKFTEEVERDIYAHSADRVVIHSASGDRVVAYVEIISPGNKHSTFEVESFCEKLDEAVQRGCHLLLIDILPPGRHDPRGMHAAFWERRMGTSHGCSSEEPLGLSAYQMALIGEDVVRPFAYFEPQRLGEPLPDMPLFFTPRHYVNVPLEKTYLEAWRGFPERWRQVVED